MKPENRIAFEVIFGVISLGMVLLRSFALRMENATRTAKVRLSLTITNIALWTTILVLLAVISSNVWTMVKVIQYRDQTEVPVVPAFELPMHLVPVSLKLAFALKIFYVVGLYGTKAAFLGIFMKFIDHVNKNLRVGVRIVIFSTIACFILNLGLTIFWCKPIEKNWDIRLGLCSAFHTMPVAIISTVTNVLTDVGIMLIPFLLLRTLKLRAREMWGVAFIFLLGFACIITAFVRFYFIYDFIHDDKQKMPSQTNPIVISSELEVIIAIWAGCLPAMRALIVSRREKSKRAASELTEDFGGGTHGKKMSYITPGAAPWSPENNVPAGYPPSRGYPYPSHGPSPSLGNYTTVESGRGQSIALQPAARRLSQADSGGTRRSDTSDWQYVDQGVGDKDQFEHRMGEKRLKW